MNSDYFSSSGSLEISHCLTFCFLEWGEKEEELLEIERQIFKSIWEREKTKEKNCYNCKKLHLLLRKWMKPITCKSFQAVNWINVSLEHMFLLNHRMIPIQWQASWGEPVFLRGVFWKALNMSFVYCSLHQVGKSLYLILPNSCKLETSNHFS